jgi:cytidine deaminase
MKSALAKPSIPIDPKKLIAQARACLDLAFAPYSQFPVAATVVDDEGRVFTGVNVENASYGLTMCAERVAIFTAVAAGARKIIAVAVTAKNAASITPCGACRQVMAEFCDPDVPVYRDNGSAKPSQSTVASLLPDAFGAPHLSAGDKFPLKP